MCRMIVLLRRSKPMKRRISRRNLSTAFAFSVLLLTAGFTRVAAAAPTTQGVRESPTVRNPRSAGIGELAPDVRFVDLDGKSGKLSDLRGKPVVLCMTSTTCPLARKYLPV